MSNPILAVTIVYLEGARRGLEDVIFIGTANQFVGSLNEMFAFLVDEVSHLGLYDLYIVKPRGFIANGVVHQPLVLEVRSSNIQRFQQDVQADPTILDRLIGREYLPQAGSRGRRLRSRSSRRKPSRK